MKTVWNAIVVVAIANLLALGAFAGWLVSSDRLDMGRVRELRKMLSVTVTEQKAIEAAAAAKADADKKAAEEAAKAGKPPLTAAEKLAARVDATQLDQDRAARLRKEVESLQLRLTGDADKLAQERAKLESEKKAFAQAVAAHNVKNNDEQFQKSLGVLVALKPAAAKSMLMQMMNAAPPDPSAAKGASESRDDARMGEVVAYLNAMEERPRSKIMTEFAKDDPKLAATLLERLRASGRLAQTPPAER